MKQKTLLMIIYGISMILLLPLVIDLFVNEQYGSSLIILFLMAFSTWGMVKLRRVDKK